MEINSKHPYLNIPTGKGLDPLPLTEKLHHITDLFTPAQTLAGAGGAAGSLFTNLLDVRVPTTTKPISEERRQEIMKNIQAGDIILESNNAYPGWQRFEMLTLRSSYTHAAMSIGDGKFIEATTGDPSGKGVIISDLNEYLEGRILLEIIRPPYKTEDDRKAAVQYLHSQLGKPYDSKFSMKDDDSLYCAEIVYNALQACPNKIDVPLKKFLGRPAVAPDSFQEIKDQKTVYSDGSNFWKNMASHWPVASVAVGTGLAGAMLLGPLGAVGGFFGGLLLSIATGNKIQTGHFNLAGSGK
jgi:uncharacterized protein YycO